jgi:hypothetical protein
VNFGRVSALPFCFWRNSKVKRPVLKDYEMEALRRAAAGKFLTGMEREVILRLVERADVELSPPPMKQPPVISNEM